MKFQNCLSRYPADAITKFRGEHHFLSNFYLARISWGGVHWASTEHAYQGLLAANPDDRAWIESAPTPGTAKRRSRLCPRRADATGAERIALMRSLLELKFRQHANLAAALVTTHPRILVEGNTWGDTFWGVDEVKDGTNVLGKLLMELRATLHTEVG
jgi:hypothetical protein